MRGEIKSWAYLQGPRQGCVMPAARSLDRVQSAGRNRTKDEDCVWELPVSKARRRCAGKGGGAVLDVLHRRSNIAGKGEYAHETPRKARASAPITADYLMHHF